MRFLDMEGLWLMDFECILEFEGPTNFLIMSRDCVRSIGVIYFDLHVFHSFPLSYVTWKFPLRKAKVVLCFQGSS